jgi:excinuclease ABC subunit C
LIDTLKIPNSPGVYLMIDALGEIIYVGKAKNLKKRVASYFKSNISSIKINIMVKQISDVRYIVVENENEALLLENRFIKEYSPKYNTRLKDSKTYPYIKINMKEKFPTIQKTRLVKKDGSVYFGPYVQDYYLKKVLYLIKDYFYLRKCKILSKKGPCLYYHLNTCKAPCISKITEEEYSQLIADVIALLNGNYDELCSVLKKRMEILANQLKFEDAQSIKEQIFALSQLLQSQKVENLKTNNRIDLFILIEINSKYLIQVFRVKNNYLAQQFIYEISIEENDENNIILKKSLLQFYSIHNDFPEYIYIEEFISDKELAMFFKEKKIKIYQKPPKEITELYTMLKKNSYFTAKKQLEYKKNIDYETVSSELKKNLSLTKKPTTIIGLDISHLSGENIVASCVYFEEGIPRKDLYRKYNIKTVMDNDDFASLYELTTRIFSKRNNDRPDLILVDGGKGQLSSVKKALEDLNIRDQDICSLAKKEEIIYLPNKEEGLQLDSMNNSRKLLQLIRDEAHRYAINFQRKKRNFLK